MPLLERKPQGQEEGSVRQRIIGGGGIGFWSFGDVQHELGPGSAICGDCPRDDGEDSGVRAEPREKIERGRWKVEGRDERKARFTTFHSLLSTLGIWRKP